MKALKYISVVISLLISSTCLADYINFLPSNFYGAEDAGSCFWFQHEHWSISSEKAADNSNYSIKYHNDSPLSGDSKAHLGYNNSEIKLNEGTYTFKVKLWLSSDAEITSFNFIIKEVWTNLNIDISAIKKDQWVEVSKDFTLNSAIEKSNALLVLNTASGGKGTLYFDELQIWGNGEAQEEPIDISFSSSISAINENLLSVPAGNYKLKLDCYIPDSTTIRKIFSQIESPWMTQEWDLASLEKDKWLTLSQDIIIPEELDQVAFNLIVNNHPKLGGGVGTILIDNIQFDWVEELAIDLYYQLDINVYPNPASNYIILETSIPTQYQLYSIVGKKVLLGQCETITTINTACLSAGTYLLQLMQNGNRKVEKIIIQ